MAYVSAVVTGAAFIAAGVFVWFSRRLYPGSTVWHRLVYGGLAVMMVVIACSSLTLAAGSSGARERRVEALVLGVLLLSALIAGLAMAIGIAKIGLAERGDGPRS